MTYQPNGVRNSVRAMPDMGIPITGRSGLLRTTPCFAVVAVPEPAAIAGPSRSFIELTRNIELAEQAPRKFVATVKEAGDVVI